MATMSLPLCVLTNSTCHPRQTRRLSPFLYASDAAPSRNLAKGVVVVLELLGSKSAEVLVTQNFTTRGPRVSRPVKHDHSPSQSSAIK